MSVTAIRNPYANAVTPRPAADPRSSSVHGGRATPAQPHAPQAASLTPIARPAAAQATERALPTEAPKGVDAELWSVLSADERAFFAKAGQMGPLTYGRAGAAMPASPAPVAMRGGRLDIKA